MVERTNLRVEGRIAAPANENERLFGFRRAFELPVTATLSWLVPRAADVQRNHLPVPIAQHSQRRLLHEAL